jgi:hypothetical protein
MKFGIVIVPLESSPNSHVLIPAVMTVALASEVGQLLGVGLLLFIN